MMSLNRYRLKHLVKNNHAGAKRVEKLLNRPDRLIGLILIGNNLVNILASSIATILGMRLFAENEADIRIKIVRRPNKVPVDMSSKCYPLITRVYV